jgi:sporulation protein YqfC
MSKKSGKKKIDEGVPGKKLRERFTELLELPKELVLNLPKLTIVGNGDMMIENYKNVMEYGKARLCVNTGIGVLKVIGAGLMIKEITSENIIISGEIHSIEFTW